MDELSGLLSSLTDTTDAGEVGIGAVEAMLPYFTSVIRYILPVLAAIILFRCIKSLLRESYDPEVWAYLSLPNGSRVPLYHWENVIGRGRSCDVVLNYPTMSRNHLALVRDDKAQWTAIDLESKSGVKINGSPVDGSEAIDQGDVIDMGGVEVALLELPPDEVKAQRKNRTRPGRWIKPSGTFFFITLFHAFLMIQHCIADIDDLNLQLPAGFLMLIGIMWGYFFFIRAMRRTGFEIEAIAFWLSGIGLSVVASKYPDEVVKTAVFILAGVIFFIVVCWILRDLNRTIKLRWPIGIMGIGFLAIGFIFSTAIYGSNNWIEIGGFTVQPSEFVKVAFVFVGAATLDRLFARRNLIMFIGYSGMCVGILALSNDFGMAAVFFAAFLMIAFLRSGDVATIALSLAAVAIGIFLVFTVKPHVAQRMATWGNVWDDPYGSGMQQALTMASTASGGLFGLGAGQGTLYRVAAADTDMVFGMVAEELGLLVAVICVIAIIVLAVFTIRSSTTARSSYYVIAAGATVTIFMTQMILNVFGSLDIIPFTGMTFPFLSKGGSSTLACWGLLAFIKAADTRQNASIAIKLNRKVMEAAELDDEYLEEDDEYDEGYDNDEAYDEEDRGEAYDDGLDARFFDDSYDWGDDQ